MESLAEGGTLDPLFGCKATPAAIPFSLSYESKLHFQHAGLGTVIPGENRTLIVSQKPKHKQTSL